MTITGRAVLPTATGLFTHPNDPGFRALRASVDRALTSLPTVDSFVLLAAGDEALVHDASAVTLVAGEQPYVRAELQHDEQMLAALSSRGQFPRVRDDFLDGPLAVLALLVNAVQPDACTMPVTVPRAAGVEALEAVAAGIVGAAQATQRSVAIVAAGELAVLLDGEHGNHPLAQARGFDADVVAALEAGDAAAMAALGPTQAGDHGAAGWAPLAVMLATGTDRGAFGTVDYLRVACVGRVVAYDLSA
ncbi:MAG TPA: hypothetical protein VK906_08000 [Egicoccus sp.]|nr:hypothetical protein [Egicoccus sp.]HSK23101.1 hypothetical protein [Egicoccus sp.]